MVWVYVCMCVTKYVWMWERKFCGFQKGFFHLFCNGDELKPFLFLWIVCVHLFVSCLVNCIIDHCDVFGEIGHFSIEPTYKLRCIWSRIFVMDITVDKPLEIYSIFGKLGRILLMFVWVVVGKPTYYSTFHIYTYHTRIRNQKDYSFECFHMHLTFVLLSPIAIFLIARQLRVWP